jgi:dolichol-phosphate mannosyltransferase
LCIITNKFTSLHRKNQVELSVVIPVYNEVESIAPLLDEICSQLDGKLDYEIIVVDDGSTDSTPGVLQSCRQIHPQLRILRHHACCGQSAAIGSGIRAAAASRIATLDGDGQNDPADILKLYEVLDKSITPGMLVTGYRKHRQDDWLKRYSSRLANAVRAWTLGDATPDSACGLKVFSRDTFLALPQFDHMHRFLPALVQRQGGQVISVEVRHRTRARGISKYGIHDRLWVGIIDLLGVRWLQRRKRRPLVSEIE